MPTTPEIKKWLEDHATAVGSALKEDGFVLVYRDESTAIAINLMSGTDRVRTFVRMLQAVRATAADMLDRLGVPVADDDCTVSNVEFRRQN